MEEGPPGQAGAASGSRVICAPLPSVKLLLDDDDCLVANSPPVEFGMLPQSFSQLNWHLNL